MQNGVLLLTALFLGLSGSTEARAQTWPADGAWRVLECGGIPSWDPVADEPAATNERDVVGDGDDPALYIAADATHLFFRIRVDADPIQGGMFSPFGWAIEFDTDADRTDYEILAGIDGIANPDEVVLRRNTIQRSPNDPADTPEQTITTYPSTTHARGVAAAGPFQSSFGGSDDFFVDMALDLADLTAEGITPATPLVLVMGTCSNAESINADIACHDGASDDPVTFTGTSTDPVRPDGTMVEDDDGDGLTDVEETGIGTDPGVIDTDRDGFDDGVEVREGTDPLDPSSFPDAINPVNLHLRGGGGPTGCAAAGAPGALGITPLLLVLLATALCARRRRVRG